MRNKKKNKYLLLLVLLLGITIGYAVLSTTLKINGSALITKNNWSVYWDNPVVTEGSVSDTLPTLSAESGKTENTIATWSATLNLPGDFYEFTIDAINNGTIDAMITNIDNTVTPELPSYIGYTVTYADGAAIGENHLLPKKTGITATVEKYKVRVEFLDTITTEQMNAIPEQGLTYTFNYHITYSQADSTAINMESWILPEGRTKNNLQLGDELCFRGECFNFVRYNSRNVVLLAKYNLNVGSNAKGMATNRQDSDVRGYYTGMQAYGNLVFSQTNYWDDNGSPKSDYPGSYDPVFPSNTYPNIYDATNYNGAPNTSNYSIAYYVAKYKEALETSGAIIQEARLLTYEEATGYIGCTYNPNVQLSGCPTTGAGAFVRNTSFWLGSAQGYTSVWKVLIGDTHELSPTDYRRILLGVRPVIEINMSNLEY